MSGSGARQQSLPAINPDQFIHRRGAVAVWAAQLMPVWSRLKVAFQRLHEATRLGLAGVGAVDALGLEGDGLGERLGGSRLGRGDLGGGHLYPPLRR